MVKGQSIVNSVDKPPLAFVNRGLFSDHFLQARLPEWKECKVDGELVSFRKSLLSLYDSKKPILPYLNEAQTELEFVQPVLDLLGYTNSYIIQAPTKLGQQTNRPDYALFPDEATKDKAYTKIKNNDYTQCIGIADAKYWERELDLAKSSERDTFTNQNPSFQIAGYLTGTKQNWGILTNGRLWRLYSAKSHLPLGNYYQVDLVRLLEEAPVENLKYFYVFFRKQALLQVDGQSFLDRVLEGSEEYAVELEADIKERAYEVVELLCRGFAADFSEKQLAELAPKDIYDNSLTLLYRLLFVFYAEARELLPLTTSLSYRDNYSMRKITRDIDEVIRKGQQLTPQSTIYYQRIGSLFGLINAGDPGLGVPEYNGGLFDSEEHPFLEERAIADAFLIPAIQQLAQAYDKELKRVVAVDYNTLSERHLGSIYEGLLEFKPRIAPHDLVTIKEKGSIKYAPADKHPDKKIAYKKGELYLANDKGERKASGSYYTPEYIVNYIVENTLDPLVKEAQDKLEALKPVVDKTITKWQKLKEQKQGLEPTDKYDRKIAEERERLLEPYLSLKVLDPAMGSGHFLARATDFLAEAIATDPSTEPPTGLTEESELTYYRRRVVESCIYGVDLNPLAVELAKLTLWLGTMAKSKPLSFLNHHLRVGNSLIGAKVADLDEIPKTKGKKAKSLDLSRAPVQLGLFQDAFNKKLYDLLQNRALIAQLPTETLEDIHNKEKWERDFEHDAERFHALADLWVSTYFANNVRWDEYNTLVENLQSTPPEWEKLLQKECVKKAVAMRDERHFFHWELEFPEVFYDERGNRKANAGFDAVVGNPPYVNFANMGAVERQYYQLKYYCTRNKSDLFALFLETSLLSWLNSEGRHGFIVSSTWLSTDSFRPLRELLRQETAEIILVPLEMGTFEDATVEPLLLLFKKGKDTHRLVHYGKFDGRVFEIVASATYDVAIRSDNYAMAVNYDGLQTSLLIHLNRVSAPCKDFLSFTRGVKTADDGRFVHKTPQQSDSYRVLKGRDVQRYSIRYADSWLWYRPDLMNERVGAVPHTKEHFLQTEKLVLQGRSGKALIVAYDNDGLFTLDTTYISLGSPSPISLRYILALINSVLVNYWYGSQFKTSTISGYELDRLPIRCINFTTPKKERKQLLEQGKELYQEYLQSQNWDKVLAFVAQCLPQKADGTPDMEHEQSDMVHDLLAFLAEEMTRLNKDKQAKSKDFLTWLEKEILKASVEDQKNKTKIRGFHESSYEDLLDVLKKNKAIPDLCPSSTRDTIAGEFNAAMNILTPLKAHIRATDTLIDQIVYKLYGLTDDEIAIVEGQQSHDKPA